VVVELTKRAEVFIVSERRNCRESSPSRVSATKAAGTAPKALRGIISPSQVGRVSDPPISIVR